MKPVDRKPDRGKARKIMQTVLLVLLMFVLASVAVVYVSFRRDVRAAWASGTARSLTNGSSRLIADRSTAAPVTKVGEDTLA